MSSGSSGSCISASISPKSIFSISDSLGITILGSLGSSTL